MNRETIKRNVLNILCSKDKMSLQIDPSLINDQVSLIKDISLDSIQLLELIVSIEDQFNISIYSEDINLEIFDNFSSLINFVENKIAKN